MTLRLESNRTRAWNFHKTVLTIMKFSAIVFVFSTTTNHLIDFVAAKTFVKTRVCDSNILCADETPSAILDANQLSNSTMNSYYHSNSCVPFGMLCTWECANDPDCTNFNYKEDVRSCELFHYTPTNCSVTPGCSHLQMPGMNSCKTIAAVKCPCGFDYLPQVDSCYRIIPKALDWATANRTCQQLYDGAHLVAIDSLAEQLAIATFFDSGSAANAAQAKTTCGSGAYGFVFWTGGQTLTPTTCRPFLWRMAGEKTAPMNYTNWASNQPDCQSSNEHCAAVVEKMGRYGWNDAKCSVSICSLCEYGDD